MDTNKTEAETDKEEEDSQKEMGGETKKTLSAAGRSRKFG
jgi:hypothetical protein